MVAALEHSVEAEVLIAEAGGETEAELRFTVTEHAPVSACEWQTRGWADKDVAIFVAVVATACYGGDWVTHHHTVTDVTRVPSVSVVVFLQVCRKFNDFRASV